MKRGASYSKRTGELRHGAMKKASRRLTWEKSMLRTCTVLLVGLALAGWSLSARAQDDDLRALVLKAQKAARRR